MLLSDTKKKNIYHQKSKEKEQKKNAREISRNTKKIFLSIQQKKKNFFLFFV